MALESDMMHVSMCHCSQQHSPQRATKQKLFFLLFDLPAVVDMSFGTVEIAISFMGSDIFSKSDDLCSKTACPVRKGPTEISLVELLPPIAPPVSGPVRNLAAALKWMQVFLFVTIPMPRVTTACECEPEATTGASSCASKLILSW